MKFLNFILIAVFVSGCGKRDAVAPATSTIPPGVAKTFTEDTESIRLLRRWVADPLPPDTTILSYHSETGWDGTAFDRWFFHSPSGFAALTEITEQRNAVQMPSDAAYKTMERPLRDLGVELGGKRPQVVWTVEWRVLTNNTGVHGLLLPHAAGEILEIERITLK